MAQTAGGIGYVEYAYAKQNKLTFTKMNNRDGKTVAPTAETFQAAAANADWNSVPGYGVVLSAVPASNRARNGIVVLEARFLLVGGQQVQVTGDPQDASILTHGASVLGTGAGAIPVPGLGLAIDEAIKGTNITVGPGYNFHVVPIGNLQERGPCVQNG